MKFIDLFSGIGGIRLGFNSFGECVFSSEKDKFARETYNANFGEEPHGDITKVDEKDIPSFDVLLAGFPCQAFSYAGKKLGFSDTRGTLFFDVARIINYHKPRAVLLENVKGLISHDGGRTFITIINTLEDMGYVVEWKVLNAKDFGLPQNRERVFIVAFLNFVDYLHFDFPKPSKEETRVGDILSKEVSDKYTISDRAWAGHLERKQKHLEKGNGFGYRLFDDSSEYTSCISARYYKDGSEILIKQADKNPRKLTPREAGRLQGFPEDFIIPVSDTQAYKQFGNSVAVPVVKAIANKIMEAINNNGE